MKLYTNKVVADWLAVTPRRVRQLRDEGVIQEKTPGLYDLRTTVIKYILYLRRGAGKAALDNERALLTKAKREAADMENGVRRNMLHSSEDVEKGIKTMCLNIRSRFLTLPAKLAPALAAMGGNQAKIFDELKKTIDETLEELRNYNTAFGERSEEDGAEND